MAKDLIRFDWALKRLLRQKANFEILEGFLSELLKFDLIIDKLGESEGNQEHETDKFNRVDIFAHTLAGELIIVELQVDSELDYFHRMLYGVSKSIAEHMELGKEYSTVKKIYSVNIVYFDLGQGIDYVYHGTVDFRGLHHHDQLQLNQKQKDKFGIKEVRTIFPEYYILKVNFFNGISKDGLDEWIYFFKTNEIKDEFKAKGLKEAREILKTNRMSDAEKQAYQHHLENKTYTASMLDSAKFEGKVEEKTKGILKALQRKKLTLEEIAEDFEVSMDFVLEIVQKKDL